MNKTSHSHDFLRGRETQMRLRQKRKKNYLKIKIKEAHSIMEVNLELRQKHHYSQLPSQLEKVSYTR